MEFSLIKFRVGEVDFGISVEEVQEIIFYPKLRTLPKPLPHVKGVFEFRDRLILLMDLRKRLGSGFTDLTRNTRVIVARLTPGLRGILVESLADFKRISTEYILPPIPLAGFSPDLLKGIYLQGDEIILLPNFNKILFSFIQIKLLPLNLFDQIALQYRFNKGQLTLILEEIQTHQKTPFSMEQVKILAKSMDLPVTQLFKITSFYPRFCPPSPQTESPESPKITQPGDQKYLQLSQRLEEEERKRRLNLTDIEPNLEAQGFREKWDRFLDQNPHLSRFGHKQDIGEEKQSFFVSDFLPLISNYGEHIPLTRYKNMARRMNLPTTRLAYLTSFYTGRTGKEEKGTAKAKGDFRTKGMIPVENHLKDLLSNKARTLDEILDTILNRQGNITHEDIRFISRIRGIPTTQVYKLASFLYGTKIILKTENLTRDPEALDNAPDKKSELIPSKAQGLRKQILKSIGERHQGIRGDLFLLLTGIKEKLGPWTPDEIKYLAFLWDIPDTRLHHLLSYYNVDVHRER